MVTKAKPKKTKRQTVLAMGFDTSTYSIAGCAMLYDALLDKTKGPVCIIHRWTKEDHFYKRLADATKAHEFVIDLLTKLRGVVSDVNDIYIGVEEPWPYGMVKMQSSAFLQQQAQIHGAFLGGLTRWGYPNVEAVNVSHWHAPVAGDLDMKNPRKEGFDKWTVRAWAEEIYGPFNWPDLIYRQNIGLISKPKTSRAKPVQPDDRYDAIGIMQYVWDKVHAGKWGK